MLDLSINNDFSYTMTQISTCFVWWLFVTYLAIKKKKWISILRPITIPRVFHRWLDPDEAHFLQCDISANCQFTLTIISLIGLRVPWYCPQRTARRDDVTSGLWWRHRDQRWPWHRPRTDASGLLGDVTKTLHHIRVPGWLHHDNGGLGSRPGWHRLRRPTT